MTELRVMVGLPGSGKSSLANYWLTFTHEVDVVVSWDKIRAEITGDPANLSHDRHVWPMFHQRIEFSLQRGFRVVADATNLKPENRKKLLDLASTLGVVASAHVLRTPYELACKRNQDRARIVPGYAMERMHTDLRAYCGSWQLETEGFEVWEYEAL